MDKQRDQPADHDSQGHLRVLGGLVSRGLLAVGLMLYFAARDGVHGTELWKTAGTANGTVMVKDINSMSAPSNLAILSVGRTTLYLSANDGMRGQELWQRDGTTDGPVLDGDVDVGAASTSLFVRVR